MTARELLNRHLDFYTQGFTPEEGAKVYTDDMVLELPYAPEGHTRRLEGPAAIGAFYSRIPLFSRDYALNTTTVIDTADGLVVEYEGRSVFIDSGRDYFQQYIAIVTVRDGRIAHIREYYNPLNVLRAMGEID